MADVVIGAGAIGLHTAYYLQKKGRKVFIIDKTLAEDNCSFGNAGYLSPSHFIPLATRDLVFQGIKWMFDNTSPFYIHPRLDMDLFHWIYLFWKHSNKKNVLKNSPHLYSLLNLSRNLTADIHQELGNSFDLHLDGCLMLFVHEKTGKHEKELALKAEKEFRMEVPILNIKELQNLDPAISDKVLGGAWYKSDGHLHPGKMMVALKNHLLKNGAVWVTENEITDFQQEGNRITIVKGEKESYQADRLVLAAGSWTSQLSKKLGISLPLQAGKGYSYTYKNVTKNISLPAILVDHRVAMTPLHEDLRVGGTMEMAGLNRKVSPQRIPPIIQAANHYYHDLDLAIPEIKDVWAGLRPVSPDGLPYIGKSKMFSNVFVATGHAMLGISGAAATGHLLAQLMSEKSTDIAMDSFHVHRFD